MAFDGITVSALTKELSERLIGSRIYKIQQPESDELIITFKTKSGQYKLLVSVDPTLPLVYITNDNKPSPMNAPNFCMLLRKHILNGRIVSITQPSLERIIRMEIEHMDEMGDVFKLIFEFFPHTLVFRKDYSAVKVSFVKFLW